MENVHDDTKDLASSQEAGCSVGPEVLEGIPRLLQAQGVDSAEKI